jgi:hypothetical protein
MGLQAIQSYIWSKMSKLFIPDRKKIAELQKRQTRALTLTADLIAGQIDPETPFRTGALAMSAFDKGKRISSALDTDTVKQIAYRVPYARTVYYGDHFNFRKAKHPKAQAFWGRRLMTNRMKLTRIYIRTYRSFK